MVNFVWYKINFLSELRLSTLYTIFMTTQLFKANTRGTADFGWLKANFFLFFGNYFNAQSGKLRVLNDDTAQPELVLEPTVMPI
jgi:hypothetical protein